MRSYLLSQEQEKLFSIKVLKLKKNQIVLAIPLIRELWWDSIFVLSVKQSFSNIKIKFNKIRFTDEYDLNYDLKNKNIPNESIKDLLR